MNIYLNRFRNLILLILIGNTMIAHDLVNLAKLYPSIKIELRYATPKNFTNGKIYNNAYCFLHKETAKKLNNAQLEFKKLGYSLKIWDAYRPLSVQQKLWLCKPDPKYVANPKKGSRHNRGVAVDVTLVSLTEGKELEMPTDFDNFNRNAHRNYRNLPQKVINNRKLLEDIMAKNGFIGLPTEWWHFDDIEWQKYPILDIKFEEINSEK